MKKIEIIRINKIVHVFIENKTKLTFNLKTKEEAIALYNDIESFNDDVEKVIIYLNKFSFEKDEYGFYHDKKNDCWYYERIDLPIPKGIRELIIEYVNSNYPTKALYNFLGLIQQNPYQEVREKLFKFIEDNGLMIINSGYFMTYKAVEKIESYPDSEFTGKENLIKEYYDKVKKWKKNPDKYYIAIRKNDYIMTKAKTNDLIIGSVGKVYNDIIAKKTVINKTDKYRTLFSRNKITFSLGEVIKEDDYDTSSAVTCSKGIHAGTENYAYSYGDIASNKNNVIIACLVNPKNVVAVPNDGQKIRTKEIFPLAVVTYENGDLSKLTFDSQYSDIDYMKHEADNLKVELKNSALWDKSPKGFEDLSKGEYQNIIKNRLTKIS